MLGEADREGVASKRGKCHTKCRCTPGSVAPETKDRSQRVDKPRRHLFSLGVVFYGMLTGGTARQNASNLHPPKVQIECALDDGASRARNEARLRSSSQPT